MGDELNPNVDTTTEGTDTGDSFQDGWDEDTTSPGMEEAGTETGGEDQTDGEESGEGTTETTGGADQTAGGEAGKQTPGADQAGQQQEPPRVWTLNHLGQQVTASEQDMVALAQKGLDYDRIRTNYDAAQPVMALFKSFAEKNGKTVPEYLSWIREQAKQAEGLSQEEARRAVDLEDREAVVRAREEQERAQQEAAAREQSRRQAVEVRMYSDIREFADTFPEAAKDPRQIPQEVWAEVRQGRSLVSAYAKFSQQQAAAEAQKAQAVARQNKHNAALSTGSMKSSGNDSQKKGAFLEGWDET